MNNKKIYVLLYYVSVLLSIFVCIIPKLLLTNGNYYIHLSELSHIIIFINILLIIVFTIFMLKKNLEHVNILFPIIYIVFTVIVLIMCVLFNNKIVIPYIHYSYYIQFILINYTLLNLYSILSFSKNNKLKQ